jgi:hypothetical protein
MCLQRVSQRFQLLDQLAGFYLVADFAQKTDSKKSLFILNFLEHKVPLDVLKSTVDDHIFDYQESLLLVRALLHQTGVSCEVFSGCVLVLQVQPLFLDLTALEPVLPKRAQLRIHQEIGQLLRCRHDRGLETYLELADMVNHDFGSALIVDSLFPVLLSQTPNRDLLEGQRQYQVESRVQLHGWAVECWVVLEHAKQRAKYAHCTHRIRHRVSHGFDWLRLTRSDRLPQIF